MSENPMSAKEKKELLSYLETAMDLEGRVLELSKISEGQCRRTHSLLQQIPGPYVTSDMKSPAQRAKKLYGGVYRELLSGLGAFLGFLFVIWQVWLEWDLYWKRYNIVYAAVVILMGLAICVFIGLASGTVIGWFVDCVRVSQAEAEIEEKQARDKARFEKDRAKREHDIRCALAGYEKDLEVIDSAKKALQELLTAHYENGPIYRKYCTFPAICQLYEYIDSGRFDNLGPAYNQYEFELRLDRILDKIDDVLMNLKAIESNQQILYECLSRVGAEVHYMNGKLDHCVSELDNIAYSTEITSLCAQQTAAATTLLSQIEYHKNRLDLPFGLSVYEGYLIAANAKIAARKKSLASS